MSELIPLPDRLSEDMPATIGIEFSDGYKQLLMMVEERKTLTQAEVNSGERLLQENLAPPDDRELDALVGMLNSMRWPSDSIIPDRDGHREIVRFTLSQYPKVIARFGLLRAMSEADR